MIFVHIPNAVVKTLKKVTRKGYYLQVFYYLPNAVAITLKKVARRGYYLQVFYYLPNTESNPLIQVFLLHPGHPKYQIYPYSEFCFSQ